MTTIDVSRSLDGNDAENTVHCTDITLDRLEVYYHNQTFAEENSAHTPQCFDSTHEREPAATYDRLADYWVMPADYQRDLFPLDSDAVRLHAVVWAKAAGEPEFAPYSAYGFRNDGRFFCPGRRAGPSTKKPELSPSRKVEEMRDERLEPDVTEVLPWPADWPQLTFGWQELVFDGAKDGKATVTKEKADGSTEDVEVQQRTYTYRDPIDLEPIDSDEMDPLDHWMFDPIMQSGTRRFLVVVVLPACVKTTKKLKVGAGRTLVSTRSKRYEKGFALRLSVRSSAVPQCRSLELDRMLQWGTAFIDTPYENGGFWVGGAVAHQAIEKNGYQGHGMDCNGFINTASQLARIDWGDGEWRHTTGKRNRPFPGEQVTIDEVEPGDLMDFTGSSHVRLVWKVFLAPDPTDATAMIPWASWIECAGTPECVRIYYDGEPLKTLEGKGEFYRLDRRVAR